MNNIITIVMNRGLPVARQTDRVSYRGASLRKIFKLLTQIQIIGS